MWGSWQAPPRNRLGRVSRLPRGIRLSLLGMSSKRWPSLHNRAGLPLSGEVECYNQKLPPHPCDLNRRASAPVWLRLMAEMDLMGVLTVVNSHATQNGIGKKEIICGRQLGMCFPLLRNGFTSEPNSSASRANSGDNAILNRGYKNAPVPCVKNAE